MQPAKDVAAKYLAAREPQNEAKQQAIQTMNNEDAWGADSEPAKALGILEIATARPIDAADPRAASGVPQPLRDGPGTSGEFCAVAETARVDPGSTTNVVHCD